VSALDEFEKFSGLGPTYAAKLLGIPWSTYSQLKNGRRQVKPHTELHIEALRLLPADSLSQLIERYAYDRKS